MSLPERQYALAGRLLAEAVTDAERDGVSVGAALDDRARAFGRTLGAEARDRAVRRPSRASLVGAVESVLREQGYEPRRDGSMLQLVNCPFHVLAREHTELVCGMNLQLMQGVVDALENDALEPELAPAPGRCCVLLRTAVRERSLATFHLADPE